MKYTNQLDRLPVELWLYIADIIESDRRWYSREEAKKHLEENFIRTIQSCEYCNIDCRCLCEDDNYYTKSGTKISYEEDGNVIDFIQINIKPYNTIVTKEIAWYEGFFEDDSGVYYSIDTSYIPITHQELFKSIKNI